MSEQFKVKHESVTPELAARFADELEVMIGEVMNGKRKADRLPVEHMIGLIQFSRCASPSPASDAELPQASAEEVETARLAAAHYGRPESDIPALIAFERHRAEQSKVPGMPGLSGAIPNFIAGFRAASTRTASDTGALREALEICAKALEHAGIGKLTREFALQNARDVLASSCIASDTRTAAGEAECDAALGRAAPASQHRPLVAAYACPAGCGCLWRDNRDGTMSLFDGEQKSCAICEPMPLADLEPMAIADHLFIDQRDDRIWLVCVEKVHKSEEEARQACRRWIKAYSRTASTDAATRSRAEGGNTQPVSVESTRPAEVDVEAERKLCEAWHGGGYQGLQADIAFAAWLAARTQADAGKAE